ncbi:MAG: ribose-5-phosphate isomerase RpiA [Halieaceae bacterium]|nr:ribose-5-phosphate isomerase RpiA [Halieaceae bacterium]
MDQQIMKEAVANAAVEFLVPQLSENTIIGIGTGSTANLFIAALAKYKNKIAATVASSFVSEEKLKAHQINVIELNETTQVDFYIDGADESNHQLQLIKGGGGALTREKIIASAAKEFLCIADESKLVNQLGAFPLPIEVIPMASNYVSREIIKLGGNPILRKNQKTDNGNVILDINDFVIEDPTSIETALNMISGVVTNGLFSLRPADKLFLGTASGSVSELHTKQ